MNGSTLRRSALLLAGLCAAPLALAQEAIVQGELQDLGPPWSFITAISLGGMLIPIAIVAIINLSEFLRNRARLATIERIAAAGQTVPPALMLQGAPPLTLPEERRRDIRRGIAFLCWGIGIGVVLYIVYGGNPRAAAWGLLFIVPGLGNFLKAWLTARDIARGSADGSR